MHTFRQFLQEGLTRVACRRCGGSGRFAYNHIHGTMCYGCRGTGTQLVDVEKERKRAEASAKKRAAKQAWHDQIAALYNELVAKFNDLYGPFDVETPLGLDKLNRAVAQATGKNIATHRDIIAKQQGLMH